MNQRRRAISPTVVLLGVASFLNDTASEIIYPILPLFLTAELGAAPLIIGLIEGAADALASILKYVSGVWSDRRLRRKPLVVSGYAIAAVSRYFIAVAAQWPAVLGARLLDRTGKGIRTAPRDALIGDATPPDLRGRAFGFHRAMDHAGAVVGPLLGTLMIGVLMLELRTAIYIAIVPGIIAAILLLVLLREPPRPEREEGRNLEGERLPREIHAPLRAIGVFALANSSDAFLLLHAHFAGVQAAWIPLLWAGNHLVKSALSTAGGTLSDRISRPRVLGVGWMIYALVYLAFPFATSVTWFVIMFLAYAVPFALTEGAERAWIASFVEPDQRGRAFGAFHLVQGFGVLGGSLVFGLYYQQISRMGAFHLGAGIAAIAAVMAFLSDEPRDEGSVV